MRYFINKCRKIFKSTDNRFFQKTTNHKQLKKRLIPSLFLVLLLLGVAIQNTVPLLIINARAQSSSPSDNLEKDMAEYEAARMLLYQIGVIKDTNIDIPLFEELIKVSDYEKSDYYGVYRSDPVKSPEVVKFYVSPAMAKYFGGSGDGNRQLTLGQLMRVMLKIIYKPDNKAWLARIYDCSYASVPGPTYGKCILREGFKPDEIFTQGLSSYIANVEKRDGFAAARAAYGRRSLRSGFEVCYTLKKDADPSKIESYIRNNRFFTNAIDVGFAAEITANLGPQDGRLSCDELAKAFFDLELWNDDKNSEFENGAQAAAIRDLIGKSAESRSKFLACVVSATAAGGIPQVAAAPFDTLLGVVSEWLAKGDETKSAVILIPGDAGVPLPFTIPASVMKSIGACLVREDVFGSELQDILDDDFVIGDTTEDDLLKDGEDTGEKCYDGGKTVFGLVPKNPIKWIVCGLSQLLADAIDRVNKGIESLLVFNPTEGDGESALKGVWSNILTTANFLFIIAFLIVIISTVLDLGIFSNYTVKKLLPRVIIALILANLSFSICSNLIAVTNVVGDATKEIILAPMTSDKKGGAIKSLKVEGEGDETTIAFTDAVNADGSGLFQTAVVAGLGTIVYLAIASGGAILLPVMAIVFVAAIIALAVLLLRRILIIMLIVFAPIAFVLWALPGGEKWFQRWWKLFIQMLLMYPMIMAAFASGIFVSWLITQTKASNGLGLMTSAMAFVAIVLPYFLIPTLFKAAGGALGNLTGMINDRSKGLIDRSKNYRDNSSQYGRRKKLKAAGKEQSGQQQLFESLQTNGDGKVEKLRSSYRRRQAFGMKGLTPKGRERSSTTRASMLGQTEEAVHKQQVQGLAESIRGMDQSSAKSFLKAVAMNQDDKHTEAERAAAISLMTQYKDVQGLEDVQERMLQEGTKGVNGKAKKPQSLKTWNDAMGKNFSEMKAISPHLATDISSGDTTGTLAMKHEQSFLGATDQNLGGMKVEGWQKFQQLNAGQAESARNSIANNDIAKANMPSDAKNYFETNNPQAAQATGQTVISNADKAKGWLDAGGTAGRTEADVRALHQGLQDKIAVLSQNPQKASDVTKHKEAATKLQDYANTQGWGAL